MHPFYSKMKPEAEKVKIMLQMIIGIGVVFLILLKLLSRAGIGVSLNQHIDVLFNLPTLEIIGRALAYAAVVELAYMLFTPGPDEAVSPLITGLASALLLSISKIDYSTSTVDLNRTKEVTTYVIVLAGLFLIKQVFVPEVEQSSSLAQQPPRSVLTRLISLIRRVWQLIIGIVRKKRTNESIKTKQQDLEQAS